MKRRKGREIWEKEMRERKDRFLLPIVLVLERVHISANMLSICSLLCGIGAAYFLIKQEKFMYFLWITGVFFFDNLDGAVARHKKKKSKYGWFVDYAVDRMVVVLLMVAAYSVSVKSVYALLPLAYLAVHGTYLLSKKKWQMVYLKTAYQLALIISIPFATIIGSLEIVLNVMTMFKKKKGMIK